MTDDKQQIQCPKCGTSISIDDVLTHQIEEKIKGELQADQIKKEEELKKNQAELDKRALELEKNKENFDKSVQDQVATKINEEKIKLFKEAQAEAEKEQASKTKLLEEKLKNQSEKLDKARETEVSLRKEKMELDEEKKAFELEKIKQLEEAKKAIFEEASKKATEEQQYVIAQLKKQLTDATKAKDDLARKLEQGSQQTQGEVLELELEDQLIQEFASDDIKPVPKGVNGADIIQRVIDKSGRVCGQIIWESKKTKSWNEGWVQKLIEDQRAAKAEIAVIVSVSLPENVNGFKFHNGVWVCSPKLIIALATALRFNLMAVSRERSMSVGKNEKMEILYSYLTGVEFRQRVEAIIEAFSSMDTSLRKERLAYEKIWSEREKQIKKVMNNTIGMYGDLSGLVALPQIASLELGDGESIK
jgi:hypothetical protein